ncbi:MAG: ATP-dependent helicase, partial [Lentisphaeria bacterium]|nr:ATP-dependent helicase [Lentisphaeria bacterium]
EEFQSCSNNITVSTLNSYGMRIVKNKSNLLSSFKMIEKKDRIWIVINHLAPVISKSPALEKKMSDKRWRVFNASTVLDFIDIFKSLGFDHEKLNSESDFLAYWHDLEKNGLHLKLEAIAEDLSRIGLIKKTSEIYRNFFKFYVAAADHLKGMNLYTLEDQKYWGWKYSEKGLRLTGAARYSHIMVDEFQDINPVDLLLIKSIRNQHDATLTVVGDDDQTIFEWRGATPHYILDPEQYFSTIRYPMKFTTCILNRNYRSPKNIVEMSGKLIANNTKRVEKNTVAVQKTSAKIQTFPISDYDAAVQAILKSWEDPAVEKVAVISRKRSQLIPYQILFASHSVPFFAAEDLNVFLTESFNSLKDLLEIKQCHKEGRGLSFIYWAEAIQKLCDRIRKYPLNRAEKESLRTHMSQAPFATMEEAVAHLYKFTNLEKIFHKITVCDILMEFLKTETVSEMMDYVGENFQGLQKDIRRADDDIFYADPPFAELIEFSKRYKDRFDQFYFDVQKAITTLSNYLQQDESEITDEQEKSMSAKLHLMTALRTKGKEYDSVFILAANEGIWPTRFAKTSEELEAERRLFYVAVTRARKELNFVLYDGARATPYLKELEIWGY